MPRTLRHELLEALDDIGVTLRWMESRGDAIVTAWRIAGRNAHGITRLGIEGNGRPVDIEALVIDRIEEARHSAGCSST